VDLGEWPITVKACGGGWPPAAMQYAKQASGGLAPEASYPYRAMSGSSCGASAANFTEGDGARVVGIVDMGVNPDPKDMAAAVAKCVREPHHHHRRHQSLNTHTPPPPPHPPTHAHIRPSDPVNQSKVVAPAVGICPYTQAHVCTSTTLHITLTHHALACIYLRTHTSSPVLSRMCAGSRMHALAHVCMN
jgi:hypothetical protein